MGTDGAAESQSPQWLDEWCGRARLDPPDDIVAGAIGTWRVIFTVGRYGIDNGGRLRVAMRLASDWGAPQTSDPGADNYLTVSTTGDAQVRAAFDAGGGLRPFMQAVTVHVSHGSLREGDEVTVTYGDPRGGSRGARAQTFIESKFEFRCLVEPFQSGIFARLPSSPVTAVIPDAPVRLVALAPSLVGAGEPFTVLVRAEDRWGNHARGWSGQVRLGSSGDPARSGDTASAAPAAPAAQGLCRIPDVRIAHPGFARLEVEDAEAGLHARTNPVRVLRDPPQDRIFWADIHGQTDRTVGTGSVDEYFAFARDVAGLDVAGHQGNDFQIDAAHWDEIQALVASYHEPGRFITFLGYEWSGNTPAGGDHNVFFPLADRAAIHRSSHWQVADRSDAASDRYPVTELYREFRGRDDVLLIPHVGGRACDPAYHEPSLEPVVEVASVHGRFEWLIEEVLRRGYRVGFVANSDDHTGRPGAAYPTSHAFGVQGGLTGVRAPRLTRQDVFAAYKRRCTYATTGERIYMAVRMGDQPMGAALRAGLPPALDVEVAGTAPLESVEVRRGLDVVHSEPLGAGQDPRRIRIAWGGATLRGRGRHVTWDGGLTVTGARILEVTPFAFDNPGEGITGWDAGHVAWSSVTCGDHDGIVLTLDDAAHATIAFVCPLVSLTFGARDLQRGAIRRDLGGVGRFVTAQLAPESPGPEQVTFRFTDREAPPGEHAYYVRAVQVDGHMAWSSPIFVTYDPQ